MGRSVASLLVMLMAFAVLAALFVALDAAAGVRLPPAHLDAAATTQTATVEATGTAAPSPTALPVQRASATSRVARAPGNRGPHVTATALPAATASSTSAGATATSTRALTPLPIATAAMPTPVDGVTPPRYGTLQNYANDTGATADYLQALDERIIALTNAERTARGLAPVVENSGLDVIAGSRSQDMIQRNYFDHYDPTGPVDAHGRHVAAVQELLQRNSVTYTEVGENLVSNPSSGLDDTIPQRAVRAWMHSPEHRDNILHASYTSIGVGLAAAYRADGLHVIITQVFLR